MSVARTSPGPALSMIFPSSISGENLNSAIHVKSLILLVPGEGLEPPTNGLQNG